MLYPVISIKNNGNQAASPPIGKLYTAAPIDPADLNQLKDAYQYHSCSATENFSLALLLKEELPTSLLPDIVSFFFLPGIIKINNCVLCTIVGDNESVLENARTNIYQFASKQGIEKMIINCLLIQNNNQAINKKDFENHLLSFSIEDLAEKYSTEIKNPVLNEPVFYLLNSPLDYQQLSAAIDTIETKFKNKDALLYEKAVRLQAFGTEHRSLQRKYSALVNELENYKKHNETIRAGSEAKELQNWYHNEYEVLPVWYKRLGHFIKAITGKRSFRSLFNDNVKKHKD